MAFTRSARCWTFAAAALAAALLACSPAPASAQDAAQSLAAIRAFGLPGVWATDCRQPPSRTNRSVYYDVSGDEVVVRVSHDGNTYIVESRLSKAERVDANTIRFDLAYDGAFGMTVTLRRRRDGRIQGVDVTDTNGQHRVADGKLLASGQETGSDERCQNVPVS